MWQSVLTIGDKKLKEIKYLESKLSGINGLNYLIKKENNSYVYLLSASDANATHVKKGIYEAICKIILVFYKFEYLNNLIEIDGFAPPICAFLSCLLHFDLPYEEAWLRKLLRTQSRFDLDGIYNFSIKKLKENWNELSNLTEGLLYVECNDAEMYDLMSFIIESSVKKNSCVFVADIDGSKVITNTSTGNLVDNIELFENENYNLINAVVSQMPSEVIFEGKEGVGECINTLKNFIKVKILKKP